jgi:hypothetical protein
MINDQFYTIPYKMLFNSVNSLGTLIFPKLQAFYSSNDTMAAYNTLTTSFSMVREKTGKLGKSGRN